MKVAVIGGGYVGLTSAVCYCEFGFDVLLIEKDKDRLELLKKGISASSEIGLESGLQKHLRNGAIHFSETIEDDISNVDAIVISVATTTPNGPDSDLTTLHEVIQEIALSLTADKYIGIFIKTSVPVGTCTIIANNMRFMRPDLTPGKHYDIIANPSFLREGSAIHDFINSNRVLVGLENENSKEAKKLTLNLYASLVNLGVPFIFTNFESAELIRAATIAFITTKMTFINEIAELCDRVGANINTVIRGIALDQGIGYKAFQITPGFGGTSYPRTVRILANTANNLGLDLNILNSVISANTKRISSIKGRIINIIQDNEGIINKKVAIFGLSFKPLTSDIRESASIFVIRDLLSEGLDVSVYDPAYGLKSKEIKKIPQDILENEKFHLEESAYDAANQSDIIVIMTNWAEFMTLDFKKISELMNKKQNEKPVILDYRNMFSKTDLSDFEYISQGC